MLGGELQLRYRCTDGEQVGEAMVCVGRYAERRQLTNPSWRAVGELSLPCDREACGFRITKRGFYICTWISTLRIPKNKDRLSLALIIELFSLNVFGTCDLRVSLAYRTSS